jgi:hypothetical protein
MMLALANPRIEPYNPAEVYKNAIQTKTSLLNLQEAQRQQEVQAQYRAFLQAHPEMIFGSGGGGGGAVPTLATLGEPGAGALTQQAFGPGGAGTAQTIPGYPDASRYAGVSPQGGGPLPASVGMPTVTPPGGGMPALATIGQPQAPGMGMAPQAQLMAFARQSPEAAMLVYQQQQAMQDRQWKLQEQALTRREKVSGYVGQLFQGVTDPASYDAARWEVQRFAPDLAAQLPQAYNPEVTKRLVKQAVDVKSSATLAIQNMQAQAEIGKYNLQLQNAGYQGLGTAVTDVLKGLTPEQVEKFGGRTSDKAIAYANQEVQRKKLEEAGEAERQKQLLGQQFQETQPLQDARKEDAGLFVYKGTGQTVPGTLKYGEVKTLQEEQDPTKGVVKLANLDEKKQLTTLKQLEPVLQQYADLVQYAYGSGGPLEHYTRSPGSVLNAAAGQATQNDPVFQAKRRALQGQLQSVVRGLGARGDLNEQELAAAKEMIANMDASMGLGLNVGFGIGRGGAGPMVGVKPSISIPDTPETGINLANELIGTVNRRIGSILQHDKYQKTPFITIRTEQQGQAPTGEMPQARPGAAPAGTIPGVPPRTWGVMPPATPGQPQPTPAPAVPQTGPLGAPPQTRYVPQQPAPVGAPAAPTAGSTPAQDQAYREYQQQRQRQSQAPTTAGQTRVAQVPVSQRYMNQSDVIEAMRQTGRSRREVEAAARARGYTVYGSKLPLPEVTMGG